MNSARENETKPIQSMRRLVGSLDSWILRMVTIVARMPIGTFTKKIHRHPIPDVMAPPISGPTATAPPTTAP
jgi:hypothetical protein